MQRTVFLSALAFLALGAGKADRYARVLPAIEMVESSGRADAVGDGGKAVGILQIHPVMVADVNRILGEDRYTLADRLDPAKSREIFRVYSDHYAKCGDAEKVARNWNGGPRGHRKAATVAYWAKVQRAMGGAK
jgi:hypothetical protein